MAGIRDECDLLRHAWFFTDADWTPPYAGDVKTLRCERCGTERREIWHERSGRLLYRRYVHTQGWVKYTKDDRPTMDDLRLGWITGQITEARKARKSLKAVR